MGPLIKSILLVEDESSDALLLERAFRKAGVNIPIVRVPNGEEAVSYFKHAGIWGGQGDRVMPGLVILDLKLPRRTGFEVLHWLRNLPAGTRRLPVVVLSSSAEPRDINRAYELGANSYLTKPQTTNGFAEMAAAFRDYWLGANQDPSLANHSGASRN